MRQCERIAQGKKLSEVNKTQLLESDLTDSLGQEFKLLQRTENMTFTPFMARLEMRYGNPPTLSSRRKWELVELMNQGKITSQSFREFEVKFMEAFHNVPDATPTEAYRMLLLKLPEGMRMRVMEKQMQHEEDHPILEVCMREGMSKEEVEHIIHGLTNENPTQIRHERPDKYIVKLSSTRAGKSLTDLYGRTFAWT
jgi:Glu-tRNA(Gln) amidotransferase subunit E-like FAD-binding protein